MQHHQKRMQHHWPEEDAAPLEEDAAPLERMVDEGATDVDTAEQAGGESLL